MTDTEMLKLCAEAMGVEGVRLGEGGPLYKGNADYIGTNPLAYLSHALYDPLHDDAQAMALVKKLHLDVLWDTTNAMNAWRVVDPTHLSAWSADLNYAIVECAAKTLAARQKGET